jgi:hypothetical protein
MCILVDDNLAFGMEEVDIGENDSGEGDADVEAVDDALITFAKHTGNYCSAYTIIFTKNIGYL